MEALRTLSQPDKEILRLRAYEGLNLNEVSVALGSDPPKQPRSDPPVPSNGCDERLEQPMRSDRPHDSRAIPTGGHA